MPFFEALDSFVPEIATAFNASELTGLDSIFSAAEAGITDFNAFDFAQGPDGFLGSIIPGAGGELGIEGWYNVDYDQPFFASAFEPELIFDAGGVPAFDQFVPELDFGQGIFEAGGVPAFDQFVPELDFGPGIFEAGGVPGFDQFVPELDFGPGIFEAGIPAFDIDVPGLAGPGIFDRISTAAGQAVTGLVNQAQAQIPKLIAQAKQQAIGQAVGAATGAVKSAVAGALPPQLAAVANNVVDRAGNATASAFGATPVNVNAAGGGGGGDGQAGTTFAGGGGGDTITAAGLLDTAVTDLKNYGSRLLASAEDKVKSFAADQVNDATASAQAAFDFAAFRPPFASLPLPVGIADQTPEEALAEAAFLAARRTPDGAQTRTPASDTEAGRLLAQRQETLAQQKRLINDTGDWRVRISLAEGSTYLYNAPEMEQGILAPLNDTFGVIFPYTPKIDVGYRATYSDAKLTHSNYTNYFYQSSSVDNIRITGTFTAQDTVEAQYVLAVIHFFRSATKMFYGQDAERGAPPPLLYISGLGEYQFNNHPCVLTSFEYNLPADVDYIRAGSPNNNGTDLLKRRTSTRNNLPTNAISGALGRLTQLFSGQGIQKGGIVYQNAPSNLSKNSPTYVPTKIDISLTLSPVISRRQASSQFSLKQYANGDLIKQGFW